MLLWACAWFGVVVPGHERGVVKLPGAEGDGGCEMCRVAPATDASHSTMRILVPSFPLPASNSNRERAEDENGEVGVSTTGSCSSGWSGSLL